MSTCKESIPSGLVPPTFQETIAAETTAGYALPWTIEITHPKGLRPLLDGMGTMEEQRKTLRAAGFGLASEGVRSELRVAPSTSALSPGPTGTPSGMMVTTLHVPLIALPTKGGSQSLTLPSLALSIERASGERLGLCTAAHTVVVRDPTAASESREAKDNPPFRSQMEPIVATSTLLIAAALLATLMAAVWGFRKRAKRVPEPEVFVDRRMPWEIARADLIALHSENLEAKAYADALSDVVRRYLGARYKMPGLESTSPELLDALQDRGLSPDAMGALQTLLHETDMVKFANAEENEARETLVGTALRVVDITTPKSDQGTLEPRGATP